MEVTRVRFEAFKSLYDVDCELDHLTVITGPNGAGKSNFVDALNFLGEVYADGLEFAVGRAGGYDNIAHRRTRRAKRGVAVEVEIAIDAADLEGEGRGYLLFGSEVEVPTNFRAYYRHRFALRTATQSVVSDFEVAEDTIELLDSRRSPIFRLSRVESDTVEVWAARATGANRLLRQLIAPLDDVRYGPRMVGERLLPTALLSDHFYYANLLYFVKRSLGRTRVFQLSPYQCRGPGVPTPNAMLERHGENLPGVADHLRRNDAKAWRQVQAAMRMIIPGLTAIEVAYTEDRRLALQFRELGVGRPWNTGEISDGTIQALALFVALFDARTPLLVVEEPENSVHPWILRQFLDLCREVAGKQLVLTTHSPVLLNYVEPHLVRLMSVANGRSGIQRLLDMAPEIRGAVATGDLLMFDAYDSGLIQEAVPQALGEAASFAEDADVR